MDITQNSTPNGPESKGHLHNAAIIGGNETTAPHNLEGILFQALPEGKAHNGKAQKVLDAIAETRAHQNKMEAVRESSGYHPWDVFESLADAAKFEEWFAKLPSDLTEVNLEPLYHLAADAKQTQTLRYRERSWEPNPANLGNEYNGPLGANHEPDRFNVQKWEKAVEKKAREHKERFLGDLRLMTRGDVPERLREAALALVGLAVEPKTMEDELTEWEHCATGPDVLATDAAMRLILRALCEIDETRLDIAREELALSRATATAIGNIAGVKG